MEGPLELFSHNDCLSDQTVSFEQILHCSITWHRARLHPSGASLLQLAETRQDKGISNADLPADGVDENRIY